MLTFSRSTGSRDREPWSAPVEVAINEIDMERQFGEHPRIGAVDVIPFVPLGDTAVGQAVALAQAFGEHIAARFDLPVYLYALAATPPDRVKLADVRRGRYEGLRATIGEVGRSPISGPSRTHPTAGAVAVGRRPFLIAYNMGLDRLPGTGETDRAPDPGVGRGVAAATGQRLLDRGAGAGTGLHEPAGFRDHADVAGVGDGRDEARQEGVELAEIGADRARAGCGVPRRCIARRRRRPRCPLRIDSRRPRSS